MSNIGSMSGDSRPQLKIGPNASVCDKTVLIGDITIGSRTVVHPGANIIAEAGPIIIGDTNIIEEMVTIANRLPPGAPIPETPPVLTIGSLNVFEVDSTCEALKVGDGNVIEAKAKVGPLVELTNGCVVGAACCLTEPEVIPENTVIYGSQCQRREMTDKPNPQFGQLDFLRRILPNYHYLCKTKGEPSSTSSYM